MPASYHDLRLSFSDDEDELKPMPMENPSWIGILGKRVRFGSARWRLPSYWPWILATFVFAILSFELHFQTTGALPTRCKQQLWIKSELESARELIEYVQLEFTDGIEEDENGHLYRAEPPGQPQFVGPPSPEIDAAWLDLMKATEVVVIGDEAKGVVNTTIPKGDGWVVSLDVYHSLHCVNLARKGFDFDYYYGDGPGQEPITYLTRDHIYHCIDHLRQSATCRGDLTPMRFEQSKFEKDRGMPVWTESHTCRNFDKIRDWAEARVHHTGHIGH